MHLKEIRAHGFKSFADKTVLTFDKGISAIVGPNGSGKSNVVDAVRWVLGEQSIKSLRGEGNMADVIFSGSKSRNGMNIASVALVFDNSDKYFPLDYEEVEIKRRVYKDGSNEYYLNGEKVRLKDISNLLLDSGLAKEGFNIISQGKIESIINSKPYDRRVIFEEASGVLKYKRRKEEALRNLDKTHESKNRVNDILSELSSRIGPLKEARDKALVFQDVNGKLENIEIALIVYQITNLNFEYQSSKEKIVSLNDELVKLSSSEAVSSAKSNEFKVKITSLDSEISDLQKKVLDLTALCERLNGEKNIINEKKSHEANSSKIHDLILSLKERELSLKNDIASLESNGTYLENDLSKIVLDIKELDGKLTSLKSDKRSLESDLSRILFERKSVLNDIDILKDKVENGGALPFAVKSVLNNPKLDGIMDVLGNVLEVPSEYSLAISTSLGFNINNIITKDEISAKNAICYLKNIGRATFFPLNVIKGKEIPLDVLDVLKGSLGFIDVASNLVKYDKIYENIVLNQLGNIIVCDNMDNALKIAFKIKNKFRIVTLSGDLINVGGSMTGGKSKSQSLILDKYELEDKLKVSDKLLEKIKGFENKVNDLDYNLKALEDSIYLKNKDKFLKDEEINSNNNKILNFKNDLDDVLKKISLNSSEASGCLSDDEKKVMNKYYDALKEKDLSSKKLDSLLRERSNLSEALSEYELSIQKDSKVYTLKSNELKDLEIKNSRLDVKLDNLLSDLNERYNMTYERAKASYKLEMDFDKASNLVSIYKKKIRELGNVNLDSLTEYDEVNTRFEFLSGQINDLDKAEDSLLKIIAEMDKVMKKDFLNTFNLVNESFSTTFKELFKGGKASLRLTNSDDLLETGVEIIASPPGKKLSTITLLSGGEKTLTAISLLFAIIKTKSSPFCILDEVEAALDEANVDTFGKYVSMLKDKSQFIIITHKKVTMEYADLLYGITMQESGVSKLVSVKLEDIKE